MIRQIDEKIVEELKEILEKCSSGIIVCKQLVYDLEAYVIKKQTEAVFANQKK